MRAAVPERVSGALCDRRLSHEGQQMGRRFIRRRDGTGGRVRTVRQGGARTAARAGQHYSGQRAAGRRRQKIQRYTSSARSYAGQLRQAQGRRETGAGAKKGAGAETEAEAGTGARESVTDRRKAPGRAHGRLCVPCIFRKARRGRQAPDGERGGRADPAENPGDDEAL